MSKVLGGLVDYSKRLKKSIHSNSIASLLITATTLISEINRDLFEWFFALTAGYIVFDRIAKYWEYGHVKDMDEAITKADVLEKQEYVRSQILVARTNFLERESQVTTAVTLKLLDSSKELDDLYTALNKFRSEHIIYGSKLDEIQHDIDIPFQNFLMKNTDVPTVPTRVSAQNKFDELEILKED